MKTKKQAIRFFIGYTRDKRICSNCIGESFLSNLVEENGKRRKCSFCGITGKTISVEELADRTEAVFEKFYQRTFKSKVVACNDKNGDYSNELTNKGTK